VETDITIQDRAGGFYSVAEMATRWLKYFARLPPFPYTRAPGSGAGTILLTICAPLGPPLVRGPVQARRRIYEDL